MIFRQLVLEMAKRDLASIRELGLSPKFAIETRIQADRVTGADRLRDEERAQARLGGGKSLEEFVAITEALHLAGRKKMDVAAPANRQCGEGQIA
jgi:hypothetical protein